MVAALIQLTKGCEQRKIAKAADISVKSVAMPLGMYIVFGYIYTEHFLDCTIYIAQSLQISLSENVL